MARGLTKKQEAFAQHYAIQEDATAAYKAAGYSWKNSKSEAVRVNAQKLVAHTTVSLRIAELKERKAKRIERQFDISVDRIAQELAAIGFANMDDYVSVDGDGDNVSLDFSDLTRVQFAAIQEITIEDIKTGKRTSKRTKFKLADKRGALVELGKHLGMFEKDNKQRQNNINIINDAAADFDSRITGVLARTSETSGTRRLN